MLFHRNYPTAYIKIKAKLISFAHLCTFKIKLNGYSWTRT